DKACLIVSHDRAFLNATVSKVWELDLGKLETYVGTFDQYLVERESRRRLAAHHYRHQQEEIKRIEEFVRRNMAGQKTKQAQSRLKYLGRIKRLPPPRANASGPSITFQTSGRSYAHVLRLEEVTLGYGDTTVVERVNLDLYRGDKIGVVGRNGSGKSTLLKTLIGELEPIGGDVKLGNNVDVAYFDQELSDLNENATVLDNIWELDPSAEAGAMRSFLGRFGFSGEDAFKKVMALSGGEKTKLCLARLLYHPANLVILDEPTNHLDIYAREALENALRDYDGSCLIVSHDRYFLNRVAEKILYLSDGSARVYDGNYAYFRERTAGVPEPVKTRNAQPKQEYIDFKEASRRRSRLKKEIQTTRDRIGRQEKKLAEVEHTLDTGVSADDWEKLHQLSDRRRELEDDILRLYMTLEELEATELD
ncbi:MAG: ABC-F family ATP-binding cassette domain-containing protein, partial [candidate division Zixibacteria bacterium]|nr:ABC-F family ATP-binding cassette domain-containing protein [candidate division Zixibacteria bacterium]